MLFPFFVNIQKVSNSNLIHKTIFDYACENENKALISYFLSLNKFDINTANIFKKTLLIKFHIDNFL